MFTLEYLSVFGIFFFFLDFFFFNIQHQQWKRCKNTFSFFHVLFNEAWKRKSDSNREVFQHSFYSSFPSRTIRILLAVGVSLYNLALSMIICIEGNGQKQEKNGRKRREKIFCKAKILEDPPKSLRNPALRCPKSTEDPIQPIMSGSSSTVSSNDSNPRRCAACRYLRRRCAGDCILSPYFPASNPQRFACVHKIFGASNVARMLQVSPSSIYGTWSPTPDISTKLNTFLAKRNIYDILHVINHLTVIHGRMLHLSSTKPCYFNKYIFFYNVSNAIKGK